MPRLLSERPHPKNFPQQLIKYWSFLQYSQTPIQAGWLIYYEEINTKK